MAEDRRLGWLALAAAAAVALRVAGICWGWPETYNADEPHLVNLALSFGGGSLRPYAFKYPTLWPYLLFAAYGAYFLLWSGFGLRRGVRDFIGLYAWHPGGFYLIGRALSSALSLGAAAVVWRLEKRRHPERLPWAALLLAYCPFIVELAHSAKPDCLMFFFCALGWAFALRVYESGQRRDHWLCGAFFGLAMASQYTALPAALALPLAGVFSRRRGPLRWVLEGTAAAGLALFAGSPYLLLDARRFAESLGDLGALGSLEPWDRGEVVKSVLFNMLGFAGPGSIAGLAAVAGLLRLLRGERGLAAVLALPLLAYFLIVSNNPDGGWTRYLLGGFPALALLAAEGLDWARRPGRPLLTLLLWLTAVAPGLVRSAAADQELRLVDTRDQATRWLAEHAPQGAGVLLDQPHASPRAAMTREELEQLYERTSAAGSPRARLYRSMADTHPGGGYRVLRVQRSARDLRSSPRHVKLSQSETPVLDVRPGLDVARASRIDYVVTSSFGANPERAAELSQFFEELYREAKLVAVFEPEGGKIRGPTLRVFSLKP